mgnify:CR=1 FL=1
MNFLKTIFGSSNSVDATEAKALISSATPPFILDVRQPDEYRAGHIAGAKLIPLGELRSRINELPQDRQILCVCASGSRSSLATSQLASAGLNPLNMRGGMSGWQNAGYPVKTGK